MKEISFEIRVKHMDLYDYMLWHTYHSAQGLLGACIGALAILIFLGNRQMIYLIVGIVILAYLPWVLFVKSKKQMQGNPSFHKPLHYVLKEEGIWVEQEGNTEFQRWEDLHRAVSTGKSIIVYTGKSNACIFPRRELGNQTGDVIAMISTHMNPKRVNIRY